MIIRWTGPALDDLEHIRGYIESDDERAAKRVLASLFKAVEQLQTTPWAGRAGRRAHSRELVVLKFPYIVAYRVVGETIEVLRILHTSRRWPTRLH